MAEFPTTRLSLVLAAAGTSGSKSREALADLCRMYWHPLYSYVRRQGHDADQAQDLTQSFIARLLEKNTLQKFQEQRGRFRTFLLASLKHFLANERDSARAQKRGGGQAPIPIDSGVNPSDSLTPEKAFERQWALGVLSRSLERLRDEFARTGKAEHFERLRGHLTGDDSAIRYRDVARELSMTEGAVKVAIHRLRLRFHEALREEISMTVAHPEDIGDEIRYLMSAIRT
jgi:RNA polymerase sigma factor (sigma-70 family)